MHQEREYLSEPKTNSALRRVTAIGILAMIIYLAAGKSVQEVQAVQHYQVFLPQLSTPTDVPPGCRRHPNGAVSCVGDPPVPPGCIIHPNGSVTCVGKP